MLIRTITLLCLLSFSFESRAEEKAISPSAEMEIKKLNQLMTQKHVKLKSLKEQKKDLIYVIDLLERKESSHIIRSSVGYSLTATWAFSILSSVIIYQDEIEIYREYIGGTEELEKSFKKDLAISITPAVLGLIFGTFHSAKINSNKREIEEYREKEKKIDNQISIVEEDLQKLLEEKNQLKSQN